MRENLVEMLKQCKTEEEALQLLQEQKIELTDEELDELRGGTLLAVDCVLLTQHI